MKYLIYEGNMERLKKKLTRIENKCKKYGCEFRFHETGEETFKDVTDENGKKVTARFIEVDVEGTARVNGWKYVASIEHTPNGNIIAKACDEEVPEKYYTTKPICEHCHSDRPRKGTYLIKNEETGEYRQVGKNCLMDFTCGMSAEAVSECMTYLHEVEEYCGYGGGYVKEYYNVREYLLYAAETIRRFGYRKSTDDPANDDTKSRAALFYNLDHGHLRSEYAKKIQSEKDESGFDAESKEAHEMSEKAVSWLDNQPENSNYIHNLKVVCSLEYTEFKNLGILASLFAAHDKDLERQAKIEEELEAGKRSKHIGNVGDRVELTVKDCRVITSWDTQFGTMRLYKITDPEGNVFTWKTSGGIPGDAVKLKGTVKDHTEYRGVLQTELSRCRVSETQKKKPDPVIDVPYEGSAQQGLDLFMKSVSDG